MGGTRLWGYILGGLLLIADCGLVFLGKGPFASQPASAAYFWMAALGGPACLVLGLLSAIRWERFAGAFLWLGAAIFALGIALQSGPNLGRYFMGLASFVLPQALVASLFLVHGRRLAQARGSKPG